MEAFMDGAQPSMEKLFSMSHCKLFLVYLYVEISEKLDLLEMQKY